MKTVVVNEYNSDSRQLQVLSSLENFDKFMIEKEIISVSPPQNEHQMSRVVITVILIIAR